MRKVLFPAAVDGFGLSRTKQEHNDAFSHETSIAMEDLALAVQAVQRKVGSDSSDDETSLDYRVRTAEAEIDAITSADAELASDVLALVARLDTLSSDAALKSAENTFTQKQTLPNADLTGKVLKYNNVATEGYGLPAIVDAYTYTGSTDQTQSCSNTLASGLYRISISLETFISDLNTSTVAIKYSFEDSDSGSQTITLDTVTLTTGINKTYTVIVYHAGAGATGISLAFDYTTGSGGSGDQYRATAVVERLN